MTDHRRAQQKKAALLREKAKVRKQVFDGRSGLLFVCGDDGLFSDLYEQEFQKAL